MIYFALFGIFALIFLIEASLYYLHNDNNIEIATWNFFIIVVLVVVILEEKGVLK